MRPDQITDLLTKVRSIADTCGNLLAEAATIQSVEEIDDDLADACNELNATVERLFDVSNFILHSTRSGGLTIH